MHEHISAYHRYLHVNTVVPTYFRPEKKTRCPSWCDRVLYSVGANGGDSVRRLALDRYWSCGPLLSDHMTGEDAMRLSAAAATAAASRLLLKRRLVLQTDAPQQSACVTLTCSQVRIFFCCDACSYSARSDIVSSSICGTTGRSGQPNFSNRNWSIPQFHQPA